MIVNEGITLFLFAGDHVATEKWIERNNGFDLVANGEGHIEPIRISSVEHKESRVRSPRGWGEQNLVILLGESIFDDLAGAIDLNCDGFLLCTLCSSPAGRLLYLGR